MISAFGSGEGSVRGSGRTVDRASASVHTPVFRQERGTSASGKACARGGRSAQGRGHERTDGNARGARGAGSRKPVSANKASTGRRGNTLA
eukprot:CAMPEP_0194536934 /NCGR_PEP_ID=MMETSP0253-20130528/76013_1 /TAXON_ID=2966 /ORGANISM="Noctiluca scintillans" /LENGTH=90 /DNA_ID=CAMNT_0039382905 /DNA_START=9 /DNA_END=278 /DNA_ORIENTATION=+